MSKSLSFFKAVTFCLLHFPFKNIVSFCVKKLLHFALKSCYILRQKLLHLGLMLHFASKLLHFALMLHFASIVTFCGVTSVDMPKPQFASSISQSANDFLSSFFISTWSFENRVA